jgi:hypothetical protein
MLRHLQHLSAIKPVHGRTRFNPAMTHVNAQEPVMSNEIKSKLIGHETFPDAQDHRLCPVMPSLTVS